MHMKTKLLFGLCFLTLLIPSLHEAHAADRKGTAAVKKANDTIKALLKEKAAPGSSKEQALASKVTKRVRGFLDVAELGRRAMRDHWGNLTKKQKKSFLTVLSELIEKNYILGLRSNLDYEVQYLSEKAEDDNILVETSIRDKASETSRAISIGYVLHTDKGKLRAYDVITDGVGLVENYRSMFNQIIGKEGFDGLLLRMKRKRDSLAKTKE